MENRALHDRQRALAWLANRLRWERTLEALRAGRVEQDEERRAA
jgi:hypothetical protein